MQSLGSALPLRRDPAPSRWAYRMHRLWLTPVFRVTMRVGLPAFVITLAAGIYLADQARREAFGQSYVAMKSSVEQRPEFLVGLLAIEGASPQLSDAVRAKLNLTLPMSRFDLDLDALRARAESGRRRPCRGQDRYRWRVAGDGDRTTARLCLALGCGVDDD